MASITKRKSKYSVVYDYYDEEGVRHQKWETWGTYAEAKKRKAEIEHKQTSKALDKSSIVQISRTLFSHFGSVAFETGLDSRSSHLTA